MTPELSHGELIEHAIGKLKKETLNASTPIADRRPFHG
jgi:hypothetical protein